MSPVFSKSSTYIVCNTVQTQGWRTENLFLREREREGRERERGQEERCQGRECWKEEEERGGRKTEANDREK